METVAELNAKIRAAHPGRDLARLIYLKGKVNLTRDPEAIVREAAARFKGSAAERILKGAVPAMGAQSGEAGADLATWYSVTRDWVSLVSAKTVLGRLDATRVPFQTRTITESGVTALYSHTIPVGSMSVSSPTKLDRLTCGVIVVFTEELFDTWAPGTESNILRILERSVLRGLDSALLDPDSSAVAGSRPASLLNGVSPLGDLTQTTAGALSDVQTLINALIDAGSDMDRALFVMHPRTATALAALNTSGVFTFPNLTALGGSILGIPVATTTSAIRSGSPLERVFALIDGARVAYADDGGLEIDINRATNLQMEDPTTMDATGPTTATSTVSMFQTHSVAVKAVRAVNFSRAHASAVAWLTSAF